MCCLTVAEAAEFFRALSLTEAEREVADRLLDEIRDRLRFLNEVGLEYLTLSRMASTFLVAKRNVSSWRRRSVHAWSVRCMYWMNLPSAFTAATRPS